MFHTVTSEQFDILKAREKEPGINIDERIYDIVKEFQRFPGISTVWSCSAHTREEYYNRGEADSPRFETDKLHIVFVTDGSSPLLLETLSQVISESSSRVFSVFRPKLQAIQLVWAFTGDISLSRRYNCWSLEYEFSNMEDNHITLAGVRRDLLRTLKKKLLKVESTTVSTIS